MRNIAVVLFGDSASSNDQALSSSTISNRFFTKFVYRSKFTFMIVSKHSLHGYELKIDS